MTFDTVFSPFETIFTTFMPSTLTWPIWHPIYSCQVAILPHMAGSRPVFTKWLIQVLGLNVQYKLHLICCIYWHLRFIFKKYLARGSLVHVSHYHQTTIIAANAKMQVGSHSPWLPGPAKSDISDWLASLTYIQGKPCMLMCNHQLPALSDRWNILLKEATLTLLASLGTRTHDLRITNPTPLPVSYQGPTIIALPKNQSQIPVLSNVRDPLKNKVINNSQLASLHEPYMASSELQPLHDRFHLNLKQDRIK